MKALKRLAKGGQPGEETLKSNYSLGGNPNFNHAELSKADLTQLFKLVGKPEGRDGNRKNKNKPAKKVAKKITKKATKKKVSKKKK